MTRIARADIITAPMIEIKPPAKPGNAWSVTEAGREWPASASAVAIDPSTGQITNRLDFNDFNLAAKLTRWESPRTWGCSSDCRTSSSCSPSPPV